MFRIPEAYKPPIDRMHHEDLIRNLANREVARDKIAAYLGISVKQLATYAGYKRILLPYASNPRKRGRKRTCRSARC